MGKSPSDFITPNEVLAYTIDHSTLDLMGKGIGNISGLEIISGSSLKELNLQSNPIGEFDSSQYVLPHLETLVLGWTQLSTIDLSSYPTLKHLNLAANRFTELDFSGLSSLIGVTIVNNEQLTAFPKGIEDLNNLAGFYRRGTTGIDVTNGENAATHAALIAKLGSSYTY